MRTDKESQTELGANRFLDDTPSYLYELLAERKARNASYSVRAFARDLGLSPAFVSQIMSGKRNLSLQQKLKLAAHLGIAVKELTVKTSPKSDARRALQLKTIEQTLEHEKILRHWYHFAILTLAQMGELSADPKAISKRLGITPSESKSAISRLVYFGYIERQGEHFVRTDTPCVIDSKKSSRSLRKFHQVRLLSAEQELEHFEQVRIDQRHFQTLFIPTSKVKVKRAKVMINQFHDELIAYLMADQPDEIFQLSLQLFSIENPKTKSKEGKSS
jgi:uncharacterized protein (TIGR02147 family)